MLAVHPTICLGSRGFLQQTFHEWCFSAKGGSLIQWGSEEDGGFVLRGALDLVEVTVQECYGGRREGPGGWRKLGKEARLKGKWRQRFLEALQLVGCLQIWPLVFQHHHVQASMATARHFSSRPLHGTVHSAWIWRNKRLERTRTFVNERMVNKWLHIETMGCYELLN